MKVERLRLCEELFRAKERELGKENKEEIPLRPKVAAWSRSLASGAGRQELRVRFYLYKGSFAKDVLPKLAS